VKIFSSIMAAIGRQLKQSVKVFHNLMLYLRLPKEESESISVEGVHGLTFVVESVYSVNASTFVVSAENEEIFGVFDLIGEQKADCL